MRALATIPDNSIPPHEPVAPIALHLHPDSPESREDYIRQSLTLRLKSACAHLSPEDFEALVLKMTREQLRSEGVRRLKSGDPS